MILATHIPINPQADLFDTNLAPHNFTSPLKIKPSRNFSGYKTEAQIDGHAPQLSESHPVDGGASPHEHGDTATVTEPGPSRKRILEVEIPRCGLPQQFRTWQILRNSDNTISIVTTDVDPQVENGSPAWDSRGYAIGASRIIGITALGETTSHAYNAGWSRR